MASNLLKMHITQTVTPSIPPFTNKRINSRSLLPIASTKCKHHYPQLFIFPLKQLQKPRIPSPSSPKCSISFVNPPTSKEEAILQAKIALSSALEKPLNNPRLAGKMKKLKQPRFRVEIPVIDDSPSSLIQLAVQVFGALRIKRKGANLKILIFWSTESLKEAATEAFESNNGNLLVESFDLSSLDTENKRVFSSGDLAVLAFRFGCYVDSN